MRDFVEYLQEAFITASGGNTYDNSVGCPLRVPLPFLAHRRLTKPSLTLRSTPTWT